MQIPIFSTRIGRWPIQVQFYLGLSSFFGIAFVVGINAVSKARTLQKASLKQHVCTVPTKKKRPHTDRGAGRGPWSWWGKSPCHFLCPMQERFGQQELAFARLWQLEEAVMSAILGWTVQYAVRRHLSSFSS